MKELLAKMNKALEVLNNTRINDFGKFHGSIREIITPFLPKEFEVTVWKIKSVNSLSLSGILDNDNAFELKMEFIDDQRVRMSNRKGRLVKCWYEQIFEGETVEEVISNQEKSSLTKNIQRQHIYIAKLKQDLLEAENYLHTLITKGEL